jgi:hypothetical protein
MSRGLMANVSYTWSHALGNQNNVTGQGAESTWITLRDARLSYADSPFDHRHSITTYWTYDLPMGKGRLFSPSNRILDRIVNYWTIGGIYKFISGAPLYLNGGRSTYNSWADGGVVFDNGMSAEQLIKRLDTIVGGYDSACQCFRADVKDLQMANGAVDPKYYRPGETPGVIGYRVAYRGKWTYQLDMSVNKEVPKHYKKPNLTTEGAEKDLPHARGLPSATRSVGPRACNTGPTPRHLVSPCSP